MGYMGFDTKPSASAKKRELEYQAESDHRTLTNAAEVAGDRKRMAGVKKHHQKVTKGMSKVGKMIGGRR